ncbi:MAG TPA: O-antigen ligase family protein, partial [Candidatus Hydrogenedens sp.]|nr:O-antigen ligase family protein [Candidatus Hydrogenedens sp.]
MNLTGKDKIICSLLFLSILIPPLVYSFEFTSFLYPKEITLSIFLILLSPFLLTQKEKLFVPIPLLFFLAFILFLCLGIFYAKVPEQTLIRSTELFLVLMFLIFIAAFYKEEKYRAAVNYGVLFSGIFVALAMFIQHQNLLPVLFPEFSNYKQLYSVFGNQNLAGTYITLIIVYLLIYKDDLLKKNIYKVLCFFILGYGLFLSNSRSAWLTAFLIFVLFYIELFRNKKFSIKQFLIVISGILLAVVLTYPYLMERITQSFSKDDVGFRVRLWVYDGTIRMFISHPILGVGFGNFYYWSPKYLAQALHSSYGGIHIRNELLTLHAHNDLLELLAETGILGLVMICIFYFLWLFTYKKSYVWMAFVLISFFNPIIISASHLVIAFLSLFNKKKEELKKIKIDEICLKERWRYIICFIGCLLIIFLSYALWIPDYKLRQAEKSLILGQDCIKQYQELVRSRFATSSMYEGYAHALMEKGDYETAYKVLKKSLTKTDSGQVYLMLGQCAQNLGKKEE